MEKSPNTLNQDFESKQSFETINITKRSKTKYWIIILALTIAILGVFLTYLVSNRMSKSASTLPSPSASPINSQTTNSDNEVIYWEIFDTNQNPNFPTGLKISVNDLPNPTVVRWKNYLLGINMEHYMAKSGGAFLGSPDTDHYTLSHQIRSIRVYDIETGETFDISLDKPTWGEFWYTTSQIVDDTYYFGVGGAFGPSLNYKLNLPPKRTSRITKLPSAVGNQISKYGNTYVSSFCYEGCTYSLYNPSNDTITPLERMTNAFNDRDSSRKEEFIGIDSQGRMILNIRDIPKNANNQQHYDTESLVVVPLSNQDTTITLLKASEFPEKMKGYFMVDRIDKIVMLGQTKVYVYDLNSSQIREIKIGNQFLNDLSSTQSYDYYSATKTKDAICFANSDAIKYAVDLVSETYLDTVPSDCKKLWQEKSKDEILKELELPENLEVRSTPVVYKNYTLIPN